MREQGWRSGEGTHLPPLWHEFNSRTRHHMWVEFVVGSRPCSEGFFSRFSGFPPSTKIDTSKFKFDLGTVDEEPLCRNSTANSIIITINISIIIIIIIIVLKKILKKYFYYYYYSKF